MSPEEWATFVASRSRQTQVAEMFLNVATFTKNVGKFAKQIRLLSFVSALLGREAPSWRGTWCPRWEQRSSRVCRSRDPVWVTISAAGQWLTAQLTSSMDSHQTSWTQRLTHSDLVEERNILKISIVDLEVDKWLMIQRTHKYLEKC